jgi:hypothetical protein
MLDLSKLMVAAKHRQTLQALQEQKKRQEKPERLQVPDVATTFSSFHQSFCHRVTKLNKQSFENANMSSFYTTRLESRAKMEN